MRTSDLTRPSNSGRWELLIHLMNQTQAQVERRDAPI